jgi:phospholipid/cholesterol/gamma-HCH transport system substrate-binding protein
MPSIRTKFSVGLFVIVGMTVVIVTVLWLGMSQYFREPRYLVAYFDESVQGLNKDSPVKYRGVGVGRVESIGVAPDGYLIQIVLNLDEPLKDKENLVAQIKSVGITGIMFVELERKKEEESRSPRLSFEPKYPVIDTRPSDIAQLLTDVSAIVENIKQIDIKGISDGIIQTLDVTRQALVEAEIQKLSSDIRNLIEHFQNTMDSDQWRRFQTNLHDASVTAGRVLETADQTLVRLDALIDNHDQLLTDIMTDLKHSVDQATAVFHNGNLLVDEARDRVSGIDRELIHTIRQLNSAGKTINRLIEQLSVQPSLMIFSEPPAPKPIDTMGD